MLRAGIICPLLSAFLFAQQPAEQSGMSAFSGWSLTADSKAAGYSLGSTKVGGDELAVMTPPVPAPANLEATLTGRITSLTFRGQPAKFTAWLRIGQPGFGKSARLSIQTERPGGVNTPLDNLTSAPQTSGDWTFTEVMIGVAADAEALTLGVSAEGGATVEIRGESLNDVPLPIAKMPAIQLSKAVEPDINIVKPNTTETAAVRPVAPMTAPELVPDPPVIHDTLPPDLPGKQKVIQAAARIAIQYVRNLPDFLCTETVRRMEDKNEKAWKQKDVLTIRVGYSEGIEKYRLMAVNGKPSNSAIQTLRGGLTEGEFGTLLAQVFSPHTSVFDWDHYALLRGRTVHVFRYKVDLSKSRYHLHFEDGSSPPQEIISAYHGTVYIDKETSEVLRLVEVADPPADFPLRLSTQVIDYEHLDIGGMPFLLPTRSQTYLASALLASHNATEFGDYQKFSAESKIEFDRQ